MNRWKIPPALEQEVLARDFACIYCGIQFVPNAPTRGAAPSWEHIVNDARIITRENMARCCRSCNRASARGPLPKSRETRYQPAASPMKTSCMCEIQRGARHGLAFSGPRSRANGLALRWLPRHHRPSGDGISAPRMGPAPATSNHTPCHRLVVREHACQRRWLQCGGGHPRAQAPFGVRWLVACLAGDDEVKVAHSGRWPATVGRRPRVTPARCRSGIGTEVFR